MDEWFLWWSGQWAGEKLTSVPTVDSLGRHWKDMRWTSGLLRSKGPQSGEERVPFIRGRGFCYSESWGERQFYFTVSKKGETTLLSNGITGQVLIQEGALFLLKLRRRLCVGVAAITKSVLVYHRAQYDQAIAMAQKDKTLSTVLCIETYQEGLAEVAT